MDFFINPNTLGRKTRPRPVNPEERLPIVYLSTKRDGNGEALDPQLIEFLKAQEAEAAVVAQEQKEQVWYMPTSENTAWASRD